MIWTPEDGTDKLKERILAFIPKHPEILKMVHPWDLLDIAGIQTDGLVFSRDYSYVQGARALDAAKAEWRKK